MGLRSGSRHKPRNVILDFGPLFPRGDCSFQKRQLEEEENEKKRKAFNRFKELR